MTILNLVTDDDEAIVTLPIKMEVVPDEPQYSAPPIETVEMPHNNTAPVIHRAKKRPRTERPIPTQLSQSDTNFNQSVPITNHAKRKRFARKFNEPLSTAINQNIEKLNNLQDNSSDIQRSIAYLDQKLNAARKQYNVVSEENRRRCVGTEWS